jgi:hypothetical protein
MGKLAGLLSPVNFKPGAGTYCIMDSMTQFGFVLSPELEPQRIESKPRTFVPVRSWNGQNEDTIIAKVLVQASEANPLKVASLDDITDAFWVRLPGYCVALLVNPENRGKFIVPKESQVLEFDVVPKDRIVVLGPPHHVGYYVKQGDSKGVLTHNRRGLTSIQFYTP